MLVVLVVSVAALMAVIDGTIVTASLQSIGADLGSRLEVSVWFTSAYLLAAGVTMPLSGWIIDRYGARRVFFVALSFFVAGSVLCALATTPGALIAFRVAQGLGGGLLEPTALTIAAATAGPDRMGAVMGWVSTVINLGPVLGPIAGTLLASSGHWEWIFLINLPLGVIVLGGALALLPKVPKQTPAPPRPDVAGLVLLPLGFVMVLLASEQIAAGRIWISASLAVAGAALLAAYVWRSRRTSRPPVVDLSLLALPGFRAGLGSMAVVGFTMYFQLVALAVYAQRALGWQGVGPGLVVATLGVGLLVSMSLSGPASDRVGARRIVTAAAGIAAAVAIVLAVIAGRVPTGVLLVVLVVFGLAFGSVAAPSFSSVYRTVPPEQLPYATPALFVTVQLAAATGASVAAVLLARLPAGTALTAGYVTIAVLLAGATVIARRLPGRAT
ncbi:DHA2 family efflux MFS transporter permease subunit [Epidermidibacterium keratini]